jgi:hypothetical protein
MCISNFNKKNSCYITHSLHEDKMIEINRPNITDSPITIRTVIMLGNTQLIIKGLHSAHGVISCILYRFQSRTYFCILHQQTGPYNAGGMCLMRSMTTCLNEVQIDICL